MNEFRIKVSGSGTLQEIVSGLERLACELSEKLDNVYYDGQSYEDSILIAEITEDL